MNDSFTSLGKHLVALERENAIWATVSRFQAILRCYLGDVMETLKGGKLIWTTVARS